MPSFDQAGVPDMSNIIQHMLDVIGTRIHTVEQEQAERIYKTILGFLATI
jgi:hypothetical protein